MPTATWWNLESDKRTHILTRALAEFAHAPYEDASLTAIVTDLGIAKGSMYQYFTDKRELYTYVLQYAHEQLAHEVSLRMPLDVYQHGDLFMIIDSYFTALYDIQQVYPLVSQCIARSMRAAPPNDAIAHTFMARYHDVLLDSIVTNAHHNRSIRSDIDHSIVMYVLQLIRNDILYNSPLTLQREHLARIVLVLDQGLRYRIR